MNAISTSQGITCAQSFSRQDTPERPSGSSLLPSLKMLRTVARAQLRPSTKFQSRSFVSTVLLTKAWETESVSELRKEAKSRGLSQQGNKATLITRLRKDDEQKAISPAPPVSPQVRHASTTEVPGIPTTEVPPPLPKTYPKEFLDVKMPTASEPDQEPRIQIPFLPDLWDSSRIKAESIPTSAQPDNSTPKMVAVAGSATHHGGGPTYSLSNFESEDSTTTNASEAGPSGFWRDLAEDLNIPTSLKLPSAAQVQAKFDAAEKTESLSGQKTYSRTLDGDEVRGLWALFGLFAGSWLAAGYFKTPSAFAEKVEEAAEKAENAAGKH
ncbi:uncharacterized protein FIBRA_04511 [Fibroporia radiculosa]|uniref:SAP domain-containing protein n=1 Tax=Fibroporia radiculosa TaxID=599839 RepID=J4G7I0_9APHY|nr:uncharacterized protein FIBRA_04511 [Fibroporia radiculosa]CCM02413.1 predicted protein [Fibroporia radiculosa]